MQPSLFFLLIFTKFCFLFAVAELVDVSPAPNHKFRRRSLESDPVFFDINFEEEPQNTVIVSLSQNSSAIFKCKFNITAGDVQIAQHSTEINSEEMHSPSTSPRIQVEWRKDGSPVARQPLSPFGRIRQLSDHSLVIERPQPMDEGFYQCSVSLMNLPSPVNNNKLTGFQQPTATTTWTLLSRRAHLSLPHLDRFEQQPKSQRVPLGGTAAFRCILPSNPPAQIEWLYNNSPINTLKGNPGNKRIAILPVTQTLEIHNVSEADRGTYRCVAKIGERSRTSQTALLEIIDNDKNQTNSSILPFNHGTPIGFLLEPPQGQIVVTEGDPVLLECLLNTSSLTSKTHRTEWFHSPSAGGGEHRVIVESIGKRVSLMGPLNSHLLINNTRAEDAGKYRCHVHTESDSFEAIADLFVKVPPKITKPPQNQRAQETTDVEFECVAEGVPQPRTTWYRNGELIVPSEYFVIASNKLRIFGVVREDQAIYQCLAENDVGSVQAAAQLIVEFTATPLPLMSGPSAPSDFAGTKSAKLALEVIDVKARSIKLQWKQLTSASGTENTGTYTVVYGDGKEDRQMDLPFNFSNPTFTIEGLHPNTSYQVRLREALTFKNEKSGDQKGWLSNPIKVTTSEEVELPGFVRNFRATVLGSETIRLDWEEPEDANERIRLTGGPFRYRLFYSKANDTFHQSSLESGENIGGGSKEEDRNDEDEERETQILMLKTSYTLHGLQKNTAYLVRVEAENGNGVGPSTAPLIARTWSDTPSEPPQAIRLETLGPNEIRMRWAPPPQHARNGALTGYKIRYRQKPGSASDGKKPVGAQTVLIEEGGVTTKTLEGLRGGTHYSLRIAAINQNGTGPFSEWHDIETPGETKEEVQIAGAPSEMRVSAAHDSVRVQWAPPVDESVLVRGYTVGWGVNVPDVEKASVGAEQRQFTIRGLRPGREYVISLRAFNKLGNGFPIYETIRTLSQSSRSQKTTPASSDDEEHEELDGDDADVDTMHNFGESNQPHNQRDDESQQSLSPPVAVLAEGISASAMRLSWIDPNSPDLVAFNPIYTIRFGISGGDPSQMHTLNTTDTEHLFDGLKPNTQYEFAVKLADDPTAQWSMSAVNRTLPAPPSSPPRELLVHTENPEGNSYDQKSSTISVKLTWIPPKYANGDVEEYILLYTDRLNRPDHDWLMDSVRGDRTSMTVSGLDPSQPYFFKVQARNVKGYGPFSPVVSYTPPLSANDDQNQRHPSRKWSHSGGSTVSSGGEELLRKVIVFINENSSQLLVGALCLGVALLLVICAVICTVRRRNSSPSPKRRRRHTTSDFAGRKLSQHYSGGGAVPDLSAFGNGNGHPPPDLGCLWSNDATFRNQQQQVTGTPMLPLDEYGCGGGGGSVGSTRGSTLYLHHHNLHRGAGVQRAFGGPGAADELIPMTATGVVASPPVTRFLNNKRGVSSSPLSSITPFPGAMSRSFTEAVHHSSVAAEDELTPIADETSFYANNVDQRHTSSDRRLKKTMKFQQKNQQSSGGAANPLRHSLPSRALHSRSSCCSSNPPPEGPPHCSSSATITRKEDYGSADFSHRQPKQPRRPSGGNHHFADSAIAASNLESKPSTSSFSTTPPSSRSQRQNQRRPFADIAMPGVPGSGAQRIKKQLQKNGDGGGSSSPGVNNHRIVEEDIAMTQSEQIHQQQPRNDGRTLGVSVPGVVYGSVSSSPSSRLGGGSRYSSSPFHQQPMTPVKTVNFSPDVIEVEIAAAVVKPNYGDSSASTSNTHLLRASPSPPPFVLSGGSDTQESTPVHGINAGTSARDEDEDDVWRVCYNSAGSGLIPSQQLHSDSIYHQSGTTIDVIGTDSSIFSLNNPNHRETSGSTCGTLLRNNNSAERQNPYQQQHQPGCHYHQPLQPQTNPHTPAPSRTPQMYGGGVNSSGGMGGGSIGTPGLGCRHQISKMEMPDVDHRMGSPFGASGSNCGGGASSVLGSGGTPPPPPQPPPVVPPLSTQFLHHHSSHQYLHHQPQQSSIPTTTTDSYRTIRALHFPQQFQQQNQQHQQLPQNQQQESPLLGGSGGSGNRHRMANIVKPVVFSATAAGRAAENTCNIDDGVGCDSPLFALIKRNNNNSNFQTSHNVVQQQQPPPQTPIVGRVNASSQQNQDTTRFGEDNGRGLITNINGSNGNHQQRGNLASGNQHQMKVAPSTEEINMYAIDNMMSTLQQLQNEFSAPTPIPPGCPDF